MATLSLCELAARLRAAAEGSYAHEAATGLLIAHDRWLRRADFLDACVEVDDDPRPVAWITWRSIPDFADQAPCSSTEADILRLAAELVGIDTGRALGRILAGLDDTNSDLVIAAVTAALARDGTPTSGHRDRFHQLVAALDRYERFCHAAGNASFPDDLRAALEEVARRRGGSHALVRTRPGCWEATHLQALAALADWSDT